MPTVKGKYGLTQGLAALKAKAADADEAKGGEVRRIEIEPAGEGRFRVVCEYRGGSHSDQELDAAGVSSKVSELTGSAGHESHALAGLIPEDATKGKVKVSFKREGADEDEEE